MKIEFNINDGDLYNSKVISFWLNMNDGEHLYSQLFRSTLIYRNTLEMYRMLVYRLSELIKALDMQIKAGVFVNEDGTVAKLNSNHWVTANYI